MHDAIDAYLLAKPGCTKDYKGGMGLVAIRLAERCSLPPWPAKSTPPHTQALAPVAQILRSSLVSCIAQRHADILPGTRRQAPLDMHRPGRRGADELLYRCAIIPTAVKQAPGRKSAAREIIGNPVI